MERRVEGGERERERAGRKRGRGDSTLGWFYTVGVTLNLRCIVRAPSHRHDFPSTAPLGSSVTVSSQPLCSPRWTFRNSFPSARQRAFGDDRGTNVYIRRIDSTTVMRLWIRVERGNVQLFSLLRLERSSSIRTISRKSYAAIWENSIAKIPNVPFHPATFISNGKNKYINNNARRRFARLAKAINN